LVQVTHLYLPGIVERRSGAILIVSSTAAYQGVPYMATYAASKGFDLLFAEALAREVERYVVRGFRAVSRPHCVRVPGSSGCAG
jgi:short-subunit dehydrogenase